jgi:hypothetical protein
VQPTLAGPLDVIDVLPVERSTLMEMLRSLDDDDWRRPTECPAYDVQGVATHVLGDDLSLLSRQRDGATSGVVDRRDQRVVAWTDIVGGRGGLIARRRP